MYKLYIIKERRYDDMSEMIQAMCSKCKNNFMMDKEIINMTCDYKFPEIYNHIIAESSTTIGQLCV